MEEARSDNPVEAFTKWEVGNTRIIESFVHLKINVYL